MFPRCWSNVLIPLCTLVLWGAPSAQTITWPISAGEYAHVQDEEREDLNKDGLPEVSVSWSSGGSGYQSYVRCVQDGRSGHRACSQTASTPYSFFSGTRVVAEPKAENRARPLVDDSCAGARRGAPDQAAMWLLSKSRRSLKWFSGRPLAQKSACLSLKQAKRLSGGWRSLEEFEGRPPRSWSVYYAARWYKNREVLQPQRVLKGRGYEIYQHRHALAIYDLRQDRHAWFVNYEGARFVANGGFKVDRWEIIKAIRPLEGGKIQVRLRTMDGSRWVTYRPSVWLRR